MASLQREWNIEGGFFQPFHVYPQNTECIRIVESIRQTPLRDVYLRGSIVEEFRPHRNSDLDLYVLTDCNQGLDIQAILHEALSAFHRPIEAVKMSYEQLNRDIPKLLLVSTRSYPVVGEVFPSVAIPADIHTARALWNQYNPTRYTNGYAPSWSLAVAKQMLRAVGVVRLIEEERLSRHLPTCLQWAWEIAPKSVANSYQQIWNTLQTPYWVSTDINPIVQWLREKEECYGLEKKS